MVSTSSRPVGLARAGVLGALAGVVGAGVMMVGEKAEQAVTHRRDSYVPGRALMTLLGRPAGDDEEPTTWNLVMHYGTGAALGALRGWWAVTGVRGPRASLSHVAARLSFDQTVENATGVGAPPSTWPFSEQAVDVGHKVVYCLITGLIADRLITPALQSRRGSTSH